MMSSPLTFFILFFVQLSTGIALLPLFLFWQSITASGYEVLFWAILVALSLSLTSGMFWYWIFLMTGVALFTFFLRTSFLTSLTPPLLSLLLGFNVTLWYGIATKALPVREALLSFFFFALLFFFFYALYQAFQEKGIQRRLF